MLERQIAVQRGEYEEAMRERENERALLLNDLRQKDQLIEELRNQLESQASQIDHMHNNN